jgi:Lrp/AsnC family transcriptional regulator for asnA, asnC and gidA
VSAEQRTLPVKHQTSVKPRSRDTAPESLLDDVNKRITEELQKDGRRSYAAIAATVGLSEAAVRQRITKMLDAGIMQIVAVTDPLTLGFHRQAMIGVRVSGDVRKVADHLSAVVAIDYVVLTAGTFDLLLEVVCADDEDLLALLNDTIRTAPGVQSTETFVYLKLAKQTYSWGTR